MSDEPGPFNRMSHISAGFAGYPGKCAEAEAVNLNLNPQFPLGSKAVLTETFANGYRIFAVVPLFGLVKVLGAATGIVSAGFAALVLLIPAADVPILPRLCFSVPFGLLGAFVIWLSLRQRQNDAVIDLASRTLTLRELRRDGTVLQSRAIAFGDITRIGLWASMPGNDDPVSRQRLIEVQGRSTDAQPDPWASGRPGPDRDATACRYPALMAR